MREALRSPATLGQLDAWKRFWAWAAAGANTRARTVSTAVLFTCRLLRFAARRGGEHRAICIPDEDVLAGDSRLHGLDLALDADCAGGDREPQRFAGVIGAGRDGD